MPNWCDKLLIVRGSNARLAEFREAARGVPAKWADGDEEEQKQEQDLCFHALRPIPAEVLAKGYSARHDDDTKSVAQRWVDFMNGVESETHRDGWHWCNHHWGTKWSIDNDGLTKTSEDGKITYRFLSAWSPIIALVKHIAPTFPDLECDLRYMEAENSYFNGRVVAKGDAILLEEASPHTISMSKYVEYGFGDQEDYCACFDWMLDYEREDEVEWNEHDKGILASIKAWNDGHGMKEEAVAK